MSIIKEKPFLKNTWIFLKNLILHLMNGIFLSHWGLIIPYLTALNKPFYINFLPI